VGLRPFFTDVLPEAQIAQLSNQQWAKRQGKSQSGKVRLGDTGCDVAENAERRNVLVQDLKQQPVKHSYASIVASASSTRVARDPLNKMASPGRANSRRNAPAARGSSKKNAA